MLVVETIGRIRRERLVKGKSIKGIARDLKLSRNTVRKVLRSGSTSFEYVRSVQPRPKLGLWHAEVVARGAASTSPKDTHYGMREIVVTTVDGHRIVFGQEVRKPTP